MYYLSNFLLCCFLKLQVLNDQTFAIMVLMAVFTTFITTPIVMAVYKPAKRSSKDYKYRSIERKDPNTQLRLLTCFHSTRNLPSMINLIEASRGTEKRERLCVYAMHLMELNERSSAILMVHKARNNGLPFWNKGRQSADNNQVVVAFETFEQLSRVAIRPMTAISSINTMHEDICTSAEWERAAMIILPFHKHQRLDGTFETTRSEYRLINQRVLENAPCSVGILVDRGLGGSTHVSASNVDSLVTVLFFGGTDDREALAYGIRMAEHPGIKLTVIHFVASPELQGEIVRVDVNDSSNTSAGSVEDKFIAELEQKISNYSSIKYEERVVGNAAEATDSIREFSQCNLFLVGRRPEGQITAALNVKSDCSELGPVGSLLTSPDFSATASVLVVQKHHGLKLPNASVGLSKVVVLPEEHSDTS